VHGLDGVVEDGRDPGVLERGQAPHLALEGLDGGVALPLVGERGEDLFDGAGAVGRPFVAREVDGAGIDVVALADALDDPVAAGDERARLEVLVPVASHGDYSTPHRRAPKRFASQLSIVSQYPGAMRFRRGGSELSPVVLSTLAA
jgi:hypothetical protein